MILTNLLLLLLVNFRFVYGCIVNCDLKFAVKCPEDKTDRNRNAMRLFLLSPSNYLSYTRDHSRENRTILQMSGKIGVTTLAYNADDELLYWTSPGLGYWTSNSRLHTVSWDYRYACENDKNAPWNNKKLVDYWESEGLERCCLHTVKRYNEKMNDRVLIEKENWNPRSLAMDVYANKIYIVDTGDRSVKVYASNGLDEATVFESEFLIPLEIALDNIKGLMFVLVVNTETQVMQIYRANMDGTSRQLLVDNDEDLSLFFVRSKVGFTIDTLKQRIYFSNVKKGIIESIDYKGNERQLVVKANYPTSINIHDHTLYWSDSRYDATAMFKCTDKKCHVRTCKLNEPGICDESTIANFIEVPGKHFGVHEVKIIDPRLQPYVWSPCEYDNGGCEHHCLLKPADEERDGLSSGCACKDGYQLAPDLKHCIHQKITHAYDIAFADKNANFTGLLSTPAKDNFFPISRKLLFRLFYDRPDRILHQDPFHFIGVSESGDELVEHRLSLEDKLIDHPKLNRSVLNQSELDRLKNVTLNLRSYQNKTIARAVAYDWITKNIYFVKSFSGGDEQGELIALRYGRSPENKNKKIREFTSERDALLVKIQTPVSMVMHPYRGYVFAALRNGSIARLNSDGSGQLLFPNVNNSRLLTVDLNDDKLYWLDTDGYVNLANLDGNESKQLLKTRLNGTELIHVYGKWLYTRCESDRRVWRFDKLTGEEAGSLEIGIEQLHRESIGVKVSARDARHIDADHPCGVKNGGCELYCFGVPEANETSKLRRQCGKDEQLTEHAWEYGEEEEEEEEEDEDDEDEMYLRKLDGDFTDDVDDDDDDDNDD